MAGKLTRGSITLGEAIKASKDLFKSKMVDDKSKRSRVDTISCKITATKNFKYNKVTKAWEDVERRSVKFVFQVKTDPISYDKKDKIKIHTYPVTILLYSIEDGINSEFRYRSGGLKKPLFAKKGATAEQRNKIAEQNIRNGTDLHFFYHLEAVLASMNLLFGPNYATRMPKKTNPKGFIYLEKHSWACVTKLLIPILNNPQAISKITSIVYKNEKRVNK